MMENSKRILLQVEERNDKDLAYQTNALGSLEILGLAKYLEEISKQLIEELNKR